MARFFPSLPSHIALGAGDHAELALLRTLEQGLSDAYSLFHSVDWSHGSGIAEQHGEIDIVVLNQQGDVTPNTTSAQRSSAKAIPQHEAIQTRAILSCLVTNRPAN